MSYKLSNIPSIGYIQKLNDTNYSTSFTTDDLRDSGAEFSASDSTWVDFSHNTYFIGRAVGDRNGVGKSGYLFNIGTPGSSKEFSGQISPHQNLNRGAGSEEAFRYGTTVKFTITDSTTTDGWTTGQVVWSKDSHIQFWRT